MPSGKITLHTTRHKEFIDITGELEKIIRVQKSPSGILYLYNPHTTAGITINEGADPTVCEDIINALNHIVPQNVNYRHTEGNSPSHLMALLTGSSVTVFIENNKLHLGTWQKVFFCEFDGPRTRSILWKILPDSY